MRVYARPRFVACLACVLVGFVAIPTLAHAQRQSAIAGSVTDATGGVLPGVTVEATSPALIEQSRLVVTDGQGLYRLVDLRAGSYTVTFSLPGFRTVIREGIELESEFTAPVNVEMIVGALEESVTVTGETPLVDVQSSQRREVLTRDFTNALPTGRNFVSIGITLPGIVSNRADVGGSTGMQNGNMRAYGSMSRDMGMEVDGMNVMALLGAGNCPCQYHNDGAFEDYVVSVAGGNADQHTGGVRINMIPKAGGDQFSGDVQVLWAQEGMQSNNVGDRLSERGATTPAGLARLHDFNANIGGPLWRNKVWFFSSVRNWAYNDFVLNQFLPEGTQAKDSNLLQSYSNRVTFQVGQRNKGTVYLDKDPRVRKFFGIQNGNVTPEAAPKQTYPNSYNGQAKWTSTVTNRVLFEFGYSTNFHAVKYHQQPGVQLQTADDPFGHLFGDISKTDLTLGVTYSSAPVIRVRAYSAHNIITSASYVTGSHSLKVGMGYRFGPYRLFINAIGDLQQRYRDGVSDSVDIRNTPVWQRSEVNADVGIYVQDSWTINRLTLNPGIRFERFLAGLPEQNAPAGRFVPFRHFDAIPNQTDWFTVAPRMGAAFDLFGNGRTAVKGSVGKYTEQASQSTADRYNPMVNSIDRRTWDDLNGDDRAQLNEIGPSSNVNFGVRRNRNPDPDLQRSYQMLYNLGVDHQLTASTSIAIDYYRRGFYLTRWTDNVEITHADYTLESVADPRGNSQMLPLYNLNPAKFGLLSQIDSNSEMNRQTYNGLDVIFSGRFDNGSQWMGGTSTGRFRSVMCEVDDPNSLRFCDETLSPNGVGVPFRTSFKMSGTVPLPYDWHFGMVFQSVPGLELDTNYRVSRRIFSGLTVPSVVIRLNEPGSKYLDRNNQLDVRLTREFTVNATRIQAQFDLFNIANVGTILREVQTYGRNLGNVQRVLPGRLLRLGVNINF